VPVTESGKRRREISCHSYLSRDGDAVIALAGAALFACCILCAVGDRAHAKSQQPRQIRDLDAVVSARREALCNQSERALPGRFGPLLDASEASIGDAIVGVASWYNPYRESDDTETASGEQYDPDKWTAAIQIDLRGTFGGVGFGKDYRAAYTLVESGDKRMIVKINDVGPLRPGRVIDLSERAMRYLDETLLVGLLPNVKLTRLSDGDWVPGPIVGEPVKSQRCAARDARRDISP
jgi:rare lipoprotein A